MTSPSSSVSVALSGLPLSHAPLTVLAALGLLWVLADAAPADQPPRLAWSSDAGPLVPVLSVAANWPWPEAVQAALNHRVPGQPDDPTVEEAGLQRTPLLGPFFQPPPAKPSRNGKPQKNASQSGYYASWFFGPGRTAWQPEDLWRPAAWSFPADWLRTLTHPPEEHPLSQQWTTHSKGLDPVTANPGYRAGRVSTSALLHQDVTKRVPTVWMWLAAYGFRFFPVFPHKPATSTHTADRHQVGWPRPTTLRWPLWTDPLPRESIQALLSRPWDPRERADWPTWGVVSVWESTVTPDRHGRRWQAPRQLIEYP